MPLPKLTVRVDSSHPLEPRTTPDGSYSEWPERGEILCHVDRLRTGLVVDTATQIRPRRPRARTFGAG
jgi:hypothetical protein